MPSGLFLRRKRHFPAPVGCFYDKFYGKITQLIYCRGRPVVPLRRTDLLERGWSEARFHEKLHVSSDGLINRELLKLTGAAHDGCSGDKMKQKQVIINILSSAIKFNTFPAPSPSPFNGTSIRGGTLRFTIPGIAPAAENKQGDRRNTCFSARM